MNYSNVKLKHLAELSLIVKSDLDQADKNIKILSLLTGKDTDYFEALPFNKLEKLCKKISFVNKLPNPKIRKIIWLGGRPYKALLNIEKFSTGRYLSIKAHAANGADENVHKIIALCYKPLLGADKLDSNSNYNDETLHVLDKRAELIAEKSVNSVLGMLFFYTKRSKKLKPIIQQYLTNAMNLINLRMREVSHQN